MTRSLAALVVGLLVSLLAPGAARAEGAVTVEGGGGVNKSGASLPTSGFAYDRLALRLELSPTVSLGGGVRLTRDFAAGAVGGSRLSTGSDWVWLMSSDVSWSVSDHVTLGASGITSPPSTRDVASSVVLGPRSAVGVVNATSTSFGGAVEAAYDSFDEATPHVVDVLVDAGLGVGRYLTRQSLTNLDPIGAGCVANLTCTSPTAPGIDDGVTQLRGEASAVTTFAERFELGLGGAVYAYSGADPTTAGTVSATIRDATGKPLGVGRYGAGIPLLPPRWSLRPEIGARWDRVSVRGYYQYAKYVFDGEAGHTVGTRIQVKEGALRLFVTGTYRADTASDGSSRSLFGGLGISVRW